MHGTVVIPYRRFGTTYLSHLQESGSRSHVCSIIVTVIITVLFNALHTYLRTLFPSLEINSKLRTVTMLAAKVLALLRC